MTNKLFNLKQAEIEKSETVKEFDRLRRTTNIEIALCWELAQKRTAKK